VGEGAVTFPFPILFLYITTTSTQSCEGRIEIERSDGKDYLLRPLFKTDRVSCPSQLPFYSMKTKEGAVANKNDVLF
jgi:hypothetical protein